MKKKIPFFLVFVVLFFSALTVKAQHNYFTNQSQKNNGAKRVIVQNKYRTVKLNMDALQTFLTTVSNENNVVKNDATTLEIPMPDGNSASFYIWKTTMMEQGLADKYASIKTYTGQGINDKTAVLKIDVSEFGFHAMILSSNGSIFIDPYSQQTTTDYIVYDKKDFLRQTGFEEVSSSSNNILAGSPNTGGVHLDFFPTGQCVGLQLRQYRLAVACSHQYAVAATGVSNPTKAQTLAKIVTTINRVNGVYETELGIHLNLIANEDAVVFVAASGDPFGANDNNPTLLINDSQIQITSIIGSANFDIGHTFSSSGSAAGSGFASVGGVCQDAYKASGVTGSLTPVGDPYDIDYVAHEMGHQFGASHTFNANTGFCNGNANNGSLASATNCEPGSGSTIMAYAGICDANGIINNLQPHSDAQFHAGSISEIEHYVINAQGNTCAIITTTGNRPPVANAGIDYIIPIATPFALTGTGTDPDGDAITYSWEEMDVFGQLGNWNDTPQTVNIPLFRSFSPKNTGTRYFPKTNTLITNVDSIGERLPTISRTMNFRLTVRDNKAGGGGTCFDDMVVNVDSTGGAFAVTYPNNAGEVWYENETKTITWNKGKTDANPFNVANVAIELSLDGGLSFPIVLKASTPNDGAEDIVVGNNYSDNARIRIRALGNIFFDISDNDFILSANAFRWLSFTGEKNTNRTVGLSFKVHELSNYAYQVESSLDSINFNKIQDIAASTATGTDHSFSYTDVNPLGLKNYYRIKRVDAGSTTNIYSKIIGVFINQTTDKWTIYPNPAIAKTTLVCNDNLNDVEIRLIDAIGRIVYVKQKPSFTTGEATTLPLSNLAKGVYFVNIKASNASSVTKKILVQ